jgi:hypothetical protein
VTDDITPDNGAPKPQPFAILLRSTVNPGGQIVVKHYAFNKRDIWAMLEQNYKFAARTEAGEIDAIVDLEGTVANVLTWEDFEKLARQSQLASPAQGAILMPRGRS